MPVVVRFVLRVANFKFWSEFDEGDELLVVGATRWSDFVNENTNAHSRWSSVIGNEAGLSTNRQNRRPALSLYVYTSE